MRFEKKQRRGKKGKQRQVQLACGTQTLRTFETEASTWPLAIEVQPPRSSPAPPHLLRPQNLCNRKLTSGCRLRLSTGSILVVHAALLSVVKARTFINLGSIATIRHSEFWLKTPEQAAFAQNFPRSFHCPEHRRGFAPELRFACRFVRLATVAFRKVRSSSQSLLDTWPVQLQRYLRCPEGSTTQKPDAAKRGATAPTVIFPAAWQRKQIFAVCKSQSL